MKVIDGGVTAAKGFEAAGTFTTNVVKAAPVLWDRDIVTNSEYAQAVVVNAGIANACTGKQGLDYCRREAEVTGRLLGIPAEAVLVGSTGVIGMQLPMDRIEAGIAKLVEAKSDTLEAGHTAACSIMTTDTISKEIAVSFELDGKEITVGGMSKGSGMIHPNMCTMLAYITTDMAISKELLQEALSTSVVDTFNMITVDGDTSTNDTCLVMANGMAGNTEVTQKGEAYDKFFEALNYVCTYLAKKMAGDGEGATKLFEAKVVNARSKEDARTLSRAIVGSNLSKAAIYGCDANFGRFLCAMGYSGAQFDQNDVELFFESENGRLQVFDHGTPIVFDEEKALQIMKADAVTVYVDMHEGEAEATAWGCDLTYDYVKINADYRS